MCRHHQNLVALWLYLVKFSRNMMLGENNELKNRYMQIEYKDDENDTHTSTRQVADKLHTNNPNIIRLIQVVGENEMSVKEMVGLVGLKDRENFLQHYLNPAIEEGYICLLYPNSPRHPRQKYLLTVKGMELYNELTK